MKLILAFLCLAGLVYPAFASKSENPTGLNIIPWPSSIETESGVLALTEGSRIAVSDESLLPLAQVLSDELYMAFGLRLKKIRESSGKGDLLLELDPRLEGEAYTLNVSDRTVVSGGNHGAVAMGTVTLLQSVSRTGSGTMIPCLTIEDAPRSSYRGLLVDVARRWHSIDTLKQIVILCRFYKIRYMQFHLSDDQSFTFPSKTYPKLATKNRHYSLDELKDLVHFADIRGVTIVPEFDAPGHTTAMRRAMPELFDHVDPETGKMVNLSVLNLGKEEIYPALDILVGEMCEVFASSPYFHIGADEAWLGNLHKAPETKEAVRRQGFDNAHDLFLDFIVRMHNFVKKHGKKTLMWESFRGTGSRKVKIPKEIIVFAWETMYELPHHLLKNGYTIINASWKPTYITPGARWNPETIYNWNMYRWENWWNAAPSYTPIQLEPTGRVIGGQMCAWEMSEEMEMPSLRIRLPALSERIWQPGGEHTFADFDRRLAATDPLLEKLIWPFDVRIEGLTDPKYVGPFRNKQNWFGESITLSMKPAVNNAKIHFTLDGSTPDPGSPLFDAPVTIDRTTTVKAGAFDRAGKAVGYTWWTRFEHRPISAKVEGLLTSLRHEQIWKHREKFGDNVTVSLLSAMQKGLIHYTLNGKEPTVDSEPFREPIRILDSAVLKARFFDDTGHARGDTWSRRFQKVDYQQNLTTGKVVTASERNEGHPPEAAVDGVVDIDHFWDAGKGAPQWLQVDLEKVHQLGRIHVYPYWDGRRFYQYIVEVSTDGENWTGVVDMRTNTAPSSPEGYRHTFEPAPVRFIRVTMLKNSANPGLHLVELRVFEAGKGDDLGDQVH